MNKATMSENSMGVPQKVRPTLWLWALPPFGRSQHKLGDTHQRRGLVCC